MVKQMNKITTAILTVLALSGAQEQDAITPEKRALLNELIKVTDLASVTRKVMANMANQVGANFNYNFMKSLPGMDKLPPEQRDKAVTLGKEMGTRVMKRMFDEMSKQINYNELIDTVYVPTYDKYYTVEDLKGLIAFYKTPTGLKFIKVMPDVQAKAARLSNATLTPKVTQIVGQIMAEEIGRLQEA